VTFASPVDFQSTVDDLPFEALPVNESRVFVIYQEAILDVERDSGPLTEATTVTISVLELSTGTGTDRDSDSDQPGPASFIERFADRVARRVDTTVSLSEE
jgi:hypothetical protein